MSTRLRYANSITGKLLRGPANALLLILALGTAAALHAQSADPIPRSARPQSQAGTYSLLYSFQCTLDGAYPFAGLIRDSSGNLYGTTYYGGQFDDGTVFKVTPGGGESVLHSFANGLDGAFPALASLTLDAAGNLYGTTEEAGEFGGGTVFGVTATGTESVLYSFTYGSSDGYGPLGGVARDNAGNLYGTAFAGGTYGYGVVFKLTPEGTYSVLHSFGSSPTDGASPASNLTRDSSGNLYGLTNGGGASLDGTVFQVTASGGGSVLYSFKGSPDGEAPRGGGLLRDTSGNLYGVTQYGGGANGYGTVFKVTPAGTESVLLSFNGAIGRYPLDGLARDAAGNLYGTTANGGPSGAICGTGCGVLFGLTTSGKEIVLHDFTLSSSSDGAYPEGGVVRDPSGNLYGTLNTGGAHGCGAVFKYTP